MARRITNGDETDAHGGWRHHLCCLSRAGVVAKTKRRTNKRERREGQAEAIAEYWDADFY